jgi:glycosyltransferase involved in cell wall biosynthesis
LIKVANLTVAIATFNRPDRLARCLDALLAGTVLPAEVIIVDQSQDTATAAILEQRRITPVSLVYIRQQQRGLSASRNAAVACAGFPIIAVTDDDCVPAQEWVAAVEQAFTIPTPPDALTGRVLPLGGDAPGLHVVSARTSNQRTEYRGKVVPWQVGTGGNFAVKREWFNRIGNYDERLGAGSPGQAAEDTDLLYRLLCAGAHIRYEPDALIFHERQSKARRLASRWGYGHGIGAFCGLWLRRGDRYALRMLGEWLLYLCRELINATKHREWLEAYQRLLGLRATMHGLLYGLRLPNSASQVQSTGHR